MSIRAHVNLISGLHHLDLQYLQPPRPQGRVSLKKAEPGPPYRVLCTVHQTQAPGQGSKRRTNSPPLCGPSCRAGPPPPRGRNKCPFLIWTKCCIALSALESNANTLRSQPDLQRWEAESTFWRHKERESISWSRSWGHLHHLCLWH